MKTKTTNPNHKSNIKFISVPPITEHPLVAKLPRWADDSPELLALHDDIAARGIDQPLIVTQPHPTLPDYLLVDGRHRLAAARLAGFDEVPVIVVDEAAAADIVLHSLINRRHYTKGALAYLSYPIVSGALVDKNDNLRRGNSPKSIQSTSVKSAEEICLELGFGRDLFFQAQRIHEAFAADDEMRVKFEPSILNDGAGLGGVLAAIAAWGTSGEGEALKSKRERHDQLFLAGFEKATGHLQPQFWKKMSVKARAEVVDKTAQMVSEWPAELAEALLPVLKARVAKK